MTEAEWGKALGLTSDQVVEMEAKSERTLSGEPLAALMRIAGAANVESLDRMWQLGAQPSAEGVWARSRNVSRAEQADALSREPGVLLARDFLKVIEEGAKGASMSIDELFAIAVESVRQAVREREKQARAANTVIGEVMKLDAPETKPSRKRAAKERRPGPNRSGNVVR